jgi:hypothetical protein
MNHDQKNIRRSQIRNARHGGRPYATGGGNFSTFRMDRCAPRQSIRSPEPIR